MKRSRKDLGECESNLDARVGGMPQGRSLFVKVIRKRRCKEQKAHGFAEQKRFVEYAFDPLPMGKSLLETTLGMYNSSFEQIVSFTYTPNELTEMPCTIGKDEDAILCCPATVIFTTLLFLRGESPQKIEYDSLIPPHHQGAVVKAGVKAIRQALKDQYLDLERGIWSATLQDELALGFNQLSSAMLRGSHAMQGCISALDGIMISISSETRTSKKSQDQYVVFQCACDHQQKFTFISEGYPESTSDQTALSSSSFYDQLVNIEPNYWLAADSAYRCSEHLITPFKPSQDGNKGQEHFNYFLDELRSHIELAFGILMARFPILEKGGFDNSDMPGVSEYFGICARLHNFLQGVGDIPVAKRFNRLGKPNHVGGAQEASFGFAPFHQGVPSSAMKSTNDDDRHISQHTKSSQRAHQGNSPENVRVVLRGMRNVDSSFLNPTTESKRNLLFDELIFGLQDRTL